MNKVPKKLIGIYGTDASRFKGLAKGIIFPETVIEVRNHVKDNERVVPRGAGTGFSGGVVPRNGLDVVMDLSKLNKIGVLDKDRKIIEVGCGVVLDDLQHYLREREFEFPVDTLSGEVCTIGGMIATNAVGGRGMRYGRTSNWIRWVEVVDGYGDVKKKGVTELSDYAGMEGTTGIIVRACLKLIPLVSRSASLVKANSLEEVENIVMSLKRNRSVSMVEFFDKKVSEGIGIGESYYLLVEYEGDYGKAKGEDYEFLLNLRKKVYGFVAREGYIRIEDLKIPLHSFSKFMEWISLNEIPIFGHIAQGIFHPCLNYHQEQKIPEMIKLARRLGGIISGSFGIGVLKKGFVEPMDKKIMENVKKRTDPLSKFNMGKLL